MNSPMCAPSECLHITYARIGLLARTWDLMVFAPRRLVHRILGHVMRPNRTAGLWACSTGPRVLEGNATPCMWGQNRALRTGQELGSRVPPGRPGGMPDLRSRASPPPNVPARVLTYDPNIATPSSARGGPAATGAAGAGLEGSARAHGPSAVRFCGGTEAPSIRAQAPCAMPRGIPCECRWVAPALLTPQYLQNAPDVPCARAHSLADACRRGVMRAAAAGRLHQPWASTWSTHASSPPVLLALNGAS